MERSPAIPTFLFCAAVAVVMMTVTACADNPVGRKCFIGDLGGVGSETKVVVASPALECQSRTCLQVPLQNSLPPNSEYASLCTATCDSDSDCDRVPESPCQTGFTCGVATVVGPFCCQKLCICRDYVIVPEAGLSTPEACNPDKAENTCVNLPGRAGS